MMKPLGDRRARVRFEVLGTLSAALEVIESAKLVNISKRGALIETTRDVPVGSIQSVQIYVGGHETRVTARVCRIWRLTAAPAQEGEPSRYVIGVEFLSTPPALAESIDQLSIPPLHLE
ncbi:MAG TPA: PilZ domain-containing protein [Vicinamibacterales bacterium]|nr:PilZ domain-containing protein [Vicinamibacterales bacterium]